MENEKSTGDVSGTSEGSMVAEPSSMSSEKSDLSQKDSNSYEGSSVERENGDRNIGSGKGGGGETSSSSTYDYSGKSSLASSSKAVGEGKKSGFLERGNDRGSESVPVSTGTSEPTRSIRTRKQTVRFTPEELAKQKEIKQRGIQSTQRGIQIRKSLLEDNMRKRRPSDYASSNFISLRQRSQPPMFKKRKREDGVSGSSSSGSSGVSVPAEKRQHVQQQQPQQAADIVPVVWSMEEMEEYVTSLEKKYGGQNE